MSRLIGWKKTALLFAMASALTPIPASAIGSVTAGGVTWAYTNDFATSAGDTVNVSLTGASASDMAFESWWFFRVSGGTFEQAFANPNIELYNGSVGSLVFANPTGSGLFNAALSFEVFDNGAGGNLFQNLHINNTSGAALTIDVFHYSDFDLGGDAGNDTVTLGSNPSGIQLNQSDGTSTAPIIGYGANTFRVSRYSQMLTDLTDNGLTNFTNNGLPLNNRDVTVGFQWTVTIAAGSQRDFLTQFASNAALLPQNATVVPEPGLAVLMGLGLLLMATPPREARRA